jgi:hypothetical protein
MQGRFPQLSAFGRKILEVCGAGIVSAAAACLIGQTDKAEAPLAPIVYLAPGNSEMLELMHSDQTALLDRLRRLPATAPAAVVPTSAPTVTSTATPTMPPTPLATAAIVPAPLPTPAVAAAPNRREAKPEPAPVMAAVKRRPEPTPNVAPAAGNAPSVIVATTMAPVPVPLASEPRTYEPPNGNGAIGSVVAEAADWVSSLKQIPGWFWPTGGGLASAAPRPPAPIGGLLPHLM